MWHFSFSTFSAFLSAGPISQKKKRDGKCDFHPSTVLVQQLLLQPIFQAGNEFFPLSMGKGRCDITQFTFVSSDISVFGLKPVKASARGQRWQSPTEG